MNKLYNKDELFQVCLSHLEKLIAINSTSNLSNLPKIEYIESILKPLGYRCFRNYNYEKDKTNLWASIGDPQKAGVVLSGHTDVVPIMGQKWTKPAFSLSLEKNKAYGRGTCDMQSFLALMLAFAPFYSKLKIPMHLCFSYDEEVGCLGIRNLVKELPKICPCLPKMCFVGEPTKFFPTIAHKGKTIFSLLVHGLEGHSAYLNEGVNAIFYAIEIIHFFQKLAKQNTEPKDFDFVVPYSSFHLGVIAGGTSLNIIPKTCKVEFEIRAIDEQKNKQNIQKISDFVQKTHQKLQNLHPDCGAEIKIDNYPSFAISKDTEIYHLACQFSEKKEWKKVDYATEASAFQKAGIPTIVIGGGSVTQAHKPDEYIELAQLEKGVDFLDKMFQHFLVHSL